jgi:putative flippase GtrA
MMARWLKFNAAGLLGVGVQLGMLHLLTRTFGLNYLVASGIAVEAAVLHNFLWHEKYTWRSRTQVASGSPLRRLLHFNLSNGAVSLVGNLVLMRMFVGWLGVPVVAANLLAIALCSTLNFAIAEFFVFGLKPETLKPETNDGGLFV